MNINLKSMKGVTNLLLGHKTSKGKKRCLERTGNMDRPQRYHISIERKQMSEKKFYLDPFANVERAAVEYTTRSLS